MSSLWACCSCTYHPSLMNSRYAPLWWMCSATALPPFRLQLCLFHSIPGKRKIALSNIAEIVTRGVKPDGAILGNRDFNQNILHFCCNNEALMALIIFPWLHMGNICQLMSWVIFSAASWLCDLPVLCLHLWLQQGIILSFCLIRSSHEQNAWGVLSLQKWHVLMCQTN